MVLVATIRVRNESLTAVMMEEVGGMTLALVNLLHGLLWVSLWLALCPG